MLICTFLPFKSSFQTNFTLFIDWISKQYWWPRPIHLFPLDHDQYHQLFHKCENSLWLFSSIFFRRILCLWQTSQNIMCVVYFMDGQKKLDVSGFNPFKYEYIHINMKHTLSQAAKGISMSCSFSVFLSLSVSHFLLFSSLFSVELLNLPEHTIFSNNFWIIYMMHRFSLTIFTESQCKNYS